MNHDSRTTFSDILHNNIDISHNELTIRGRLEPGAGQVFYILLLNLRRYRNRNLKGHISTYQ